MKKDIPEATRAMGLRGIRVAQLKGFQNYVCSEKAQDELLLGAVAAYERDEEKAANIKHMMEQRAKTMLVEFEDLGRGYSKASKQVMCCEGEKKCPYEDTACRFKLQMSELATTHVIVTNHYFLATRMGYLSHMKEKGEPVMWVFDEAHKLPEIIDRMQAGKFNLSVLGRSASALLEAVSTEERPHWLSGSEYLNSTMQRHLKLVEAGVAGLSRRIAEHKTETVNEVTIAKTAERDQAVDRGILQGKDVRSTGEFIENKEILDAVISSFYTLTLPLERVLERVRKEIGEIKTKVQESGTKALTMEEAKALDMLSGVETAASHFNRLQKRYSKERLLGDSARGDNDIARVFWMDRGTENLYFRYGAAVGPKAERGYYGDSLAGIFGPRNSRIMLISATMSASALHEYLEPMARKFRLFGRKEMKFFSNQTFDYARNVRLSAVTSPVFARVDYKQPHTILACNNEMIEHFSRVIPKVDGGSLILFTNQSNMRYVTEGLRKRFKGMGIEVLMQGDEPTHRLIDKMRRGPIDGKTYVLCGIETFWEGVDLRGKALRGLFIAKIPFGSPEDPIESKRRDLYKSQNVDYFRTKGLPETLMVLRQGFGRLIRDDSDFGVVELLDHRFSLPESGPNMQPRYLANVRNAFPIPIEVTPMAEEPARIEAFFAERGAEKKRTMAPVRNRRAERVADPVKIPEETYEVEDGDYLSLSL